MPRIRGGHAKDTPAVGSLKPPWKRKPPRLQFRSVHCIRLAVSFPAAPRAIAVQFKIVSSVFSQPVALRPKIRAAPPGGQVDHLYLLLIY